MHDFKRNLHHLFHPLITDAQNPPRRAASEGSDLEAELLLPALGLEMLGCGWGE